MTPVLYLLKSVSQTRSTFGLMSLTHMKYPELNGRALKYLPYSGCFPRISLTLRYRSPIFRLFLSFSLWYVSDDKAFKKSDCEGWQALEIFPLTAPAVFSSSARYKSLSPF